jgi:hypothetical protein
MAIKQEYIETVLGAVCHKLGYTVSNAALYREVVPAEVTDEQLEAECAKLYNISGYTDVESAKEFQRNKWRQARIPLLAALDIEWIRAMETGETNKIAQIVAKKQELRDITNTLLPDDIEGILNTWPSALNS